MLMPFERVVGDSSKDHTVTAFTSATTCATTVGYTTMRDSTRQARPPVACANAIGQWSRPEELKHAGLLYVSVSARVAFPEVAMALASRALTTLPAEIRNSLRNARFVRLLLLPFGPEVSRRTCRFHGGLIEPKPRRQ